MREEKLNTQFYFHATREGLILFKDGTNRSKSKKKKQNHLRTLEEEERNYHQDR